MSRSRELLVVVVIIAAAVLFGRLTWGFFAPALEAFAAVGLSVVASIPAWVWWTAFGVGIWFAKRSGLLPFGCCGRSCRTSRASGPAAGA